MAPKQFARNLDPAIRTRNRDDGASRVGDDASDLDQQLERDRQVLKKFEAKDAVKGPIRKRQSIGDIAADKREPSLCGSRSIDLAQVESGVLNAKTGR
jgi:hypothetical protein